MGNDVNFVSMIGYGTFITQEFYKTAKNPQVCFVKGYQRVYPHHPDIFYPFILPQTDSSNKQSGFFALLFEILPSELRGYDHYEGVSEGLYKREMLNVFLKGRKLRKAFIYIPTEKTIEKYKLSLQSDLVDKWHEEIKSHPKILEEFPDLAIKSTDIKRVQDYI